jgi:hypothetical protein
VGLTRFLNKLTNPKLVSALEVDLDLYVEKFPTVSIRAGLKERVLAPPLQEPGGYRTAIASLATLVFARALVLEPEPQAGLLSRVQKWAETTLDQGKPPSFDEWRFTTSVPVLGQLVTAEIWPILPLVLGRDRPTRWKASLQVHPDGHMALLFEITPHATKVLVPASALLMIGYASRRLGTDAKLLALLLSATCVFFKNPPVPREAGVFDATALMFAWDGVKAVEAEARGRTANATMSLIDEPEDKQLQDFNRTLITVGLDKPPFAACDELPNAQGPFGRCPTNPIPVNGIAGEFCYMNTLRLKSKVGFMFHRKGSLKVPVSSLPVDVYELVAIDASEWHDLYFSMYFPRRSRKVPDGLFRVQWSSLPEPVRLGLKLGFFGTDVFVENFPLGLPKVVSQDQQLRSISAGLPAVFARKIQETLDQHPGKWQRPAAR